MAPYKLVAEVFLEGLHEAFASEEAMMRMAEALDLKMFDRTASSRIFLKRLLDHAEATAIPEGRPGKMSENRWDCAQVVNAMMEMEEDFSLLMQVIPNLFALPYNHRPALTGVVIQFIGPEGVAVARQDNGLDACGLEGLIQTLAARRIAVPAVEVEGQAELEQLQRTLNPGTNLLRQARHELRDLGGGHRPVDS